MDSWSCTVLYNLFREKKNASKTLVKESPDQISSCWVIQNSADFQIIVFIYFFSVGCTWGPIWWDLFVGVLWEYDICKWGHTLYNKVERLPTRVCPQRGVGRTDVWEESPPSPQAYQPSLSTTLGDHSLFKLLQPGKHLWNMSYLFHYIRHIWSLYWYHHNDKLCFSIRINCTE
jgi:hypothetical protein